MVRPTAFSTLKDQIPAQITPIQFARIRIRFKMVKNTRKTWEQKIWKKKFSGIGPDIFLVKAMVNCHLAKTIWALIRWASCSPGLQNWGRKWGKTYGKWEKMIMRKNKERFISCPPEVDGLATPLVWNLLHSDHKYLGYQSCQFQNFFIIIFEVDLNGRQLRYLHELNGRLFVSVNKLFHRLVNVTCVNFVDLFDRNDPGTFEIHSSIAKCFNQWALIWAGTVSTDGTGLLKF